MPRPPTRPEAPTRMSEEHEIPHSRRTDIQPQTDMVQEGAPPERPVQKRADDEAAPRARSSSPPPQAHPRRTRHRRAQAHDRRHQGAALRLPRLRRQYPDAHKVSPSSARRARPKDHPDYDAAVEFSHLMAEAGWMVITGAGDGIMKAGHEGPGARPASASPSACPSRPPPTRSSPATEAHQLPLLLHPQAHVPLPGRRRRPLPRRLRHPGRTLRGPHPHPDRQGRHDPHRPRRGRQPARRATYWQRLRQLRKRHRSSSAR
jgi:hypothetical protein